MTPQRLATVGAVATLAISLVSLAGNGVMWRLLAGTPFPPMLYVMPVSAVCGLITGGALLLILRNAPLWQARALAAALAAVAAVVVLEYLLSLRGGLESLLFPEQVRTLLGGANPGRPAPQSALIFLFLGIALWFLAAHRHYRFDFADLGIGLALFLSFMVLLGHLFQARALYQPASGGAVGMSALETLLVLVAGISALCMNPDGVVASYVAEGPAGSAKRRIIPIVILVPVMLGLLQFWAVKSGALEFSLALALIVTANIVAFLALSEWISRFLARLDEEKTGLYVRRETQAKQEGITDTLTSLMNRRGWDQAVRDAEARCRSERLNACVTVVDLDGLKHINDTEGHAKGDDFIRRASTALKSAARREDVLARLGGDEFACLSVGCPPENALIVLKRLSQALLKGNVPASLGYAMRDQFGSILGAFQEADRNMYTHKRARKAEKSLQTRG